MNSTNIQHDQTKQETNLVLCPKELLAFDPNAENLWVIFLKRVGFHLDNQKQVIENETRRADIVRRFGVPSLMQRLSITKDEISRARVWWRECMACSEGETVPDLSADNMHVLNPFIITKKLKFKNERLEALNCSKQSLLPASQTAVSLMPRRGRPAKPDAQKRAASADRSRKYRESKRRTERHALIEMRATGHASESVPVSD